MNQTADFPHQGKKTYVLTRGQFPREGTVRFYSGDLRELVEILKSREGKNIFCDGGAETVNRLLKAGLMDELFISFIPVLLGAEIRLFQEGILEEKLELICSNSYPSGLVQVHYQIKCNS